MIIMQEVKTIHVILEFLGHPLVVSIVTIVIGSYFIDKLNKKREKREKKIDGAVGLAEDISNALNSDLTNLFLQVRSQNFVLLPSFINASLDAFKNRLKFKIRIKTYYNEEVLFNDYNKIIREISSIKQSIERYPKDPIAENKYIEDRISALESEWNIHDYKIEDLKAPFHLYFSWAQILWLKAERYSLEIYTKSIDVK